MDKKSIGLVLGISLLLVVSFGVVSASPTIDDGEINLDEYDSQIQNSSNVTDYIELGNNSLIKDLEKQTVTNETITAVIGSYVDLGNENIVNESVEVLNSSGSLMNEGSDYEVDYEEGRLKALSNGSIVDGNNITVNYSFNPVSVEVINRENGSVEINVSSHLDEGRTLVFTLSRDVLNVSSEGEILVKLDNESLSLADSLSDVLEPDKDTYWPQEVGNNSSVILVSISNWSTHSLEITTGSSTGIIGGTIEDARGFLTQKIGPMQAWIYLLIAAAVVIVAASKLEGG